MPKLSVRRVKRLQACLTEELLKPEFEGDRHPLWGHCYVACEALWHDCAKGEGFMPHVVRVGHVRHWFLKRPADGAICDPIAPSIDDARSIRYSNGRACGFLTRHPSRRARILLDRMWDTHCDLVDLFQGVTT